MGSDLINSLHRWNDGQRMIDEMPIVVFKRKGITREEEITLERH